MTSLLLAIIYVAFVSLGLPDPMLGAAWPSMYLGFGVDISLAGIISMIIAAGTVASSLMSDRFTKAVGVGKVMVISVATTAVALAGFSVSSRFWQLCLWAVPYGLGAGSVDAALNNYVALHYKSRHMSWLHCMWGVGTVISPAVMGWVLTHGYTWQLGYRSISLFQVLLTAILAASLPLWKKAATQEASAGEVKASGGKPLSLKAIFSIAGAGEIMLAFFCYSAVEQTSMLWAASYLALHEGMASEQAAFFASMFFIGITVGRGASGFVTMKLNDTQMIRLGQAIILVGIALIALPLPVGCTLAGLITVGLGCAPVYPCIIHSTPAHFGADKSQAIIGVQMASAYVGTTFMPPLFGSLASRTTIALYPFYILFFLCVMWLSHERLVKKTGSC